METNELFYRVIHSEGKLNNTQKVALIVIMDYQRIKEHGHWTNTPLSHIS